MKYKKLILKFYMGRFYWNIKFSFKKIYFLCILKKILLIKQLKNLIYQIVALIKNKFMTNKIFLSIKDEKKKKIYLNKKRLFS